MAKPNFDASASALGYVFQIRFALLMALRKVRAQPDVQISLETLDDVAFDNEGSPQELFQTKHHIKSEADLTDYSGDLWKTLRVWSTSKQSGQLKDDARLFLVPTATEADKSVASHLRESKRDIGMILFELVLAFLLVLYRHWQVEN